MTAAAFLRKMVEGQGLRLHLWLEDENGEGFGSGRIELLRRVEECGSLNRAAKELGMSYRAAWGKLKKVERTVGLSLVEASGAKRDGGRLSAEGRALVACFEHWQADVERFAVRRAKELFSASNPDLRGGGGSSARDDRTDADGRPESASAEGGGVDKESGYPA